MSSVYMLEWHRPRSLRMPVARRYRTLVVLAGAVEQQKALVGLCTGCTAHMATADGSAAAEVVRLLA